MTQPLLAVLTAPAARLTGRLDVPAKLALVAALGIACVLPVLLWSASMQRLPWLPLLLAGLFVYVAVAVAVSVSASLKQLQRMVDAVCAGDLAHSVTVNGRDELAQIGTRVEAMTRQLSQIVARIRSESQLIGMAGERLATGARDLSDRTETQASSLEQTAASLTELSDTTSQTAQAAAAVTELAQRVRHDAEAGVAVVGESVAAMQRIEQRSRQMHETLSVIDGIAFQTNILALNAAVEAARAGEAGRGFAVVAGEVRSLAQRSAQAATEVKALIDSSNTEVAAGVVTIGKVSGALGSVVDGIRSVATRMAEMSASNASQANSLREVVQAVDQLDQITQHNAQMADLSVHAAERLRGQAAVLSQAVATMRLRQGCADEARALVERAAALIDSDGLNAARQRFHDREGGFIDRDLFILVLDRENHFRAFGVDPSKADKPAVAAPGTDVVELCARTWRAADEGGGWVEYRSMHPVTQLIVDKIGFVMPAHEGQYAVLCGVNRSDGTQAASTSDQFKARARSSPDGGRAAGPAASGTGALQP